MSIRERIAAYAAAVGPTVSGEMRMPLSDSDGIALAGELDDFRHPDQVRAALKQHAEAGEQPKDDVDEIVAWAGKVKKAADAFWDAFEGEQVDGVTVIRRRK